MRRSLSSGFTLVELLVVVIILGVLAAIAIPQFSSNTEDAKVAALDSSLAELRSSVELYYHQHNAIYPGAHKYTDGSASGTTAEADTALVNQLTLYSSATGKTSVTQTDVYKYGPYLKKGLPKNPFNDLTTIKTDITTTDISAAASSGTCGWKFYTKTGRLLADDGAHDTR